MLRKHASLIIMFCLVAVVTAACIVRTGRPAQRSQPVYVEKHKKQKKMKKVKHKHRKHR